LLDFIRDVVSDLIGFAMKKIIIDATALGHRTTGVERYAKEILPRLINLLSPNYQVEVLYSKDLTWCDTVKIDKKNVNFKLLVNYSRLIRDQLLIPFHFFFRNCDLIWFPVFPPSPLLIFFRGKRKVVRTIFDGVIWNQRDKLSFANKYYYSIEENINLFGYDGVHTISEFSRGEINAVVENKLDVVVSGIGVNDFSVDGSIVNESERASNRILFVGTIEPRKNLIFLLNVITVVRRTIPDIKLCIAGRNGWGSEAVHEKVHELNLNDTVEFLGAVTDLDLKALYKSCTAFVFPSLSEGFGLPPVEAMTAGCPVISSNAGALAETVGDGGILLSPNDFDGWVNSIIKILENSTFREQLVIRGYENAKKYSWDAVAKCIANDFSARLNS
jgi:glycosyltransferase involved in cell wall biosynthesis